MLTKIAIGFLVLMLTLIGVAGVAVQQSGILMIDVEDKTEGVRFRLPVPLFLAHLALDFVPERELRQARRELDRVGPVMQDMLQTLESVPDVRLVEFQSKDENVVVAKVGSDLVVDVDTPSESVYVRVPVHGVRSVLSTLSTR